MLDFDTTQIKLGLSREKEILEELGNPHLAFSSLHVAGTNGKGSVCAMLASILIQAGYKVGLYTSPHLFRCTERIKINGRDIPEADFKKKLQGIDRIAAKMKRKPTVFERLTAAAFWHFAEKRVDFAVVEAGLGGRLDATNVIIPLVSVITNVDLEHTAYLGDTLAKIAYEKAGIIKAGVPVVTAEDKKEPRKVIRRVCREKNCYLIAINQKQKAIDCGLPGRHQRMNAACAVAAIRLAGIKITRAAIEKGLQEVNWPARLQIVSRRPLVVVDGAHNPAGMRALKAALIKLFPGKKFTLVFGCQKDKASQKMLDEIKPVASKIILTRSSHKLARRFPHSVQAALAKWGGEEPLLIAGSLYLAAEGLQRLDHNFRL